MRKRSERINAFRTGTSLLLPPMYAISLFSNPDLPISNFGFHKLRRLGDLELRISFPECASRNRPQGFLPTLLSGPARPKKLSVSYLWLSANAHRRIARIASHRASQHVIREEEFAVTRHQHDLHFVRQLLRHRILHKQRIRL